MSLKAKIEALLFLTTDALTAPQIAVQANADINDVRSALSQLIQEYESRFDSGVTIDTSRGYTMVVKEEYETLTQDILPLEIKTGCLRTLSVIALKEPIYQSELVKMRGGGAYEHIKELMEMNLLKKKKEGNSYVLSTTGLFDEFFKMTADGLELQHLLEDADKKITFARGGESLEEALAHGHEEESQESSSDETQKEEIASASPHNDADDHEEQTEGHCEEQSDEAISEEQLESKLETSIETLENNKPEIETKTEEIEENPKNRQENDEAEATLDTEADPVNI